MFSNLRRNRFCWFLTWKPKALSWHAAPGEDLLLLPALWDEGKQVGGIEGGHMVERGSGRVSTGG